MPLDTKGEVLLGGKRLFDVNGLARAAFDGPPVDEEEKDAQQVEQQQILVLLRYFGTPTHIDIQGMGSPIATESSGGARWMRLPPQPPTIDWRSLIQRDLAQRGGVGEGERDACSRGMTEILELLAAIFKWNPHARPSSQGLARFAFLAHTSPFARRA